MKKRNLLFVAVIIAFFTLAISLKTRREAKTIVSEESEPSLTTQKNQQSSAPEGNLTEIRSAKNLASGETDSGVELKIHAAQLLAEVNGVAITTKDLFPIGASDASAEFSFSPERYDFLLQRAIHRELAIQTAQARGVSLNPDQSRQLEQVRRSVQMRYGGDPEKVFPLNVTGSLEDQIAFEVRDASASLLLESMLRKNGVASGHVTEAEVVQYLQEHQAELQNPQKHETSQNLNARARQRLASQTLLRHQETLNKFLEELKSGAAIKMFPPAS